MKKIAIALLALIISTALYSREVNLNKALELAEGGNPELRIKRLELEKKELDVSQGKKKYLPVISLGSEYQLTEDEDGEDGRGYTTIDASLPIFTGGARYGRLKQSQVDEKIEAENLDLLSLGIKEQVIFKYFDILNAKRNIEIDKEVIKTLGKQRERLEAMYEGGQLIPKSELLKVESDILKAEAQKYTFEQTLAVLKHELKILLGLDQSEELILEGYDYNEIDLNIYDLNSGINTALTVSNRANLERMKTERAEHGITIARSEFLPKVDLRASYILDEGYNQNDGDDYQVALVARWLLFDWGSNIDNYKQSKRSLEQAMIDTETGLDKLAVDVRSKYADMMSLNIQAKSQEKDLEINRENFEIDTMRYDNGLIGSFEYLDSINNLARAESNYVRLQRDLVLSVVRYEDVLK